MAILTIVYWTKSIFKLSQEFDQSNPFVKFGRNQMINDQVKVSTSANQQKAVAIFVIFHKTKPISKLGESLMEVINIYKIWKILGDK